MGLPFFGFSQEWDASGGAFSPWFNPIADLMITVGAVIFLLAGIKVYNNWQLGNGNTFQDTTNLFGGALFLLVVGISIRVIFY